MLTKHAKKGRLVYVAGKMQTRRWRKDGEDSDRFSTETTGERSLAGAKPIPSGQANRSR